MSYNKVIINGETKIDLTADTVAADKMLADTTAHDKAGEQVTGNIPVDQEPEVSGTTTTYKAGYYSTPIVVEEGTTSEGDPIISGSVEDKTLVLNKQSGAAVEIDLTPLDSDYVKKDGDTLTGTFDFAGAVVSVATPTEGAHAGNKTYIDNGIGSFFKALVDGKNTTKLFYAYLEHPYNAGKDKFDIINSFGKIVVDAWKDKTYTLRFYKASVSGDYTGTPLDDLADGRQAAPLVTDSSEPTEDWAENDPMTWYIRANALSLADGTMDILYFEGEDGFDITGEIAPVYSFALNLYLKHWTDESYKYTSWKTIKADGYNSMAEGIAPDNSYRTVTWHPSFDGGLNAAGGLTSGANKKPVIWTSAQDALPLARKVTPYEGLWTDCDQQYVLSQWQLRHWTLENSDVLNGCQSYNYQYTLAVAESDVKRLIVTTEQGANFIVGSNVCLGEKGANESTDRNQAYNHDIFNCATITSIENVNISEVEYTALNLDIEEPITTTTTMLVSTIAWSSGTTEVLQGHSDGCIGNLTNGKYPIRIAGIEIMNGANIEELDPLWQASIVEDHWKYEVYSCRDSEKQAGSITGDYEKIGEFNLTSATEYTWFWVKDMNELESEAMIPLEFGGSSSTYYRSAVGSPGGSGGVRSPARGGGLSPGAISGLVCADGSWAPAWSGWYGAARLTGAGKKRGEFVP